MPFSFGNKAVNEGERRQLLCTVVSGDEPLSMKWSLQGQDLGPGPDLTTTQLGTHTSILMLSSVNYRHTGTYTCTVSNPAGMTSHSAELVVNGNYILGLKEGIGNIHNFFILEPPSILPFTFGNAAVNEGEPRQLICSVIKGDSPLQISWSFQGVDIGPNPDIITSQLGEKASLLMISSVSYKHSGLFTCQASNLAGTTSFSTELLVNGK